MTRLPLTFALAALALAMMPLQSAVAQPPPAATRSGSEAAARYDLAKRYLTVGGTTESVVDLVSYSMLRSFEQRRLTLTAAQRHQLSEGMREIMAPAMDAMIDDLAASYADLYTTEDLTTALAYYESPAGRRYVKAPMVVILPLIMSVASGGVLPDSAQPATSALDPATLQAAQKVAAVVGARFREDQRKRMEDAGLSMERLVDVMSRGLADKLSVAELNAASEWLTTPVAQRLEGPSAERDRATELATASMVQKLDLSRLVTLVQSVLAKPQPPT